MTAKLQDNFMDCDRVVKRFGGEVKKMKERELGYEEEIKRLKGEIEGYVGEGHHGGYDRDYGRLKETIEHL